MAKLPKPLEYHVFIRHDGAWGHHNTFRSRTDALDERRDLRRDHKARDIAIVRTYLEPCTATDLALMRADLNAGLSLPNLLKL